MFINEASQRKLIANSIVIFTIVGVIGIVCFIFITNVSSFYSSFQNKYFPSITPSPLPITLNGFKKITNTPTLTPTLTLRVTNVLIPSQSPAQNLDQIFTNGQTITNLNKNQTIIIKLGQVVNINLGSEYPLLVGTNPNILHQVARANDIYTQGTYQAINKGTSKMTAVSNTTCENISLKCKTSNTIIAFFIKVID